MWMTAKFGTAARKYVAWGSLMSVLVMITLLLPSAALAQAQKVAKGKSDKNALTEIGNPGWVKVCPKQTREASVCLVQTDGLNQATGEFYSPVKIEISKSKGKEKKLLIATVQHILPMVLVVPDQKTKTKKNVLAVTTPKIRIPTGVRFRIDKGEPVELQIVWCDQIGCSAIAEVKDDLINKLKKGEVITLAFMEVTKEKPVPLVMPLKGFGKTFDGPAIETSVFESRIKSRQSQLQKRAQAMRKKMQQNGAASNTATTVKKKN